MDKYLRQQVVTTSVAKELRMLSGIDKKVSTASGGGPIGMVTPFAGLGDQGDWLICDGRSLNSAEYPELFGVIGNAYGGSGGVFNLPNLRGRTVIGVGQGAGLTNRQLGEAPGAENVTLNENQIPGHNHGASSNTTGGHAHTNSMTSNGSHDHGGATSTISANHTHNFTFQREAVFAAGTNRAGVFNIGGAGDNVSSNTGNVSANHTHGITSGGGHSHTVTVDAAGGHAHTITTSNTGGGQSHTNMQPSLALSYIIRAR